MASPLYALNPWQQYGALGAAPNGAPIGALDPSAPDLPPPLPLPKPQGAQAPAALDLGSLAPGIITNGAAFNQPAAPLQVPLGALDPSSMAPGAAPPPPPPDPGPQQTISDPAMGNMLMAFGSGMLGGRNLHEGLATGLNAMTKAGQYYDGLQARRLLAQQMFAKLAIENQNKMQQEQFQQQIRPMNGTAQKSEDAALSALGTATQTQQLAQHVIGQLQSGQLDLGPFNNAINGAENWLGISTPASRNYASFRADLEQLRNASLRLNKGVQTEGDAQRAWNEITAHITDTKFVTQRLQEISAINARAAQLQRQNIQNNRERNNKPPMDLGAYETGAGNAYPNVQQGAAPSTGGAGFSANTMKYLQP